MSSCNYSCTSDKYYRTEILIIMRISVIFWQYLQSETYFASLLSKMYYFCPLVISNHMELFSFTSTP